MDTRNKVVTAGRAAALAGEARAAGRRILAVTGHFDVLLAEHARDLRRVAGNTPGALLLVALTPPPRPVLSSRARAELVAALAVVDYVVTAEAGEIEGLLAALQPDGLYRTEAADEGRQRQLIEHVQRRHTG